MTKYEFLRMSRRELLRLGGITAVGTAAALYPATADAKKNDAKKKVKKALAAHAEEPEGPCSGGDAIEEYPTSPLIGGYIDSSGRVAGSAFTDPLPIPIPLEPCPPEEYMAYPVPPGPESGHQDCDGGTHQYWPTTLGLPDPLYYHIQVQVAPHRFTTLKALPIDKAGQPTIPPGSANDQPRQLPASTIYGYNGTFPGPMIYARYGQPVCIRFENLLDQNPYNLDRCDFGDPNLGFLTHLHNAHTAPESDGNPGFKPQSYRPTDWCDNLYLNYPPDGDDNEKQSFFWFHDHRMDHTGANVYKGMVGIYPIYDPKLDPGDERFGLRLPGVPNPVTTRIDYDIPLVLFDCSLDDGVTPHKDFHNGCGEVHPEWWGKTFFRHFPDRGFVGDVFTVNGVANPVLEVKRRKYRFRFLDASIARCYKLKLVASTDGPQAAPGQQGQYTIDDGQQCMRFMQIATDGGLMPFPIERNAFELWPAKRREVVVDFSRYMDGTPTTKGDVMYLVNTMEMTDGRKPDDPDDVCVPIMKIVIGDDAEDNSVMPSPSRMLRPQAVDPNWVRANLRSFPKRRFELKRSGTFGGEIQWLINDLPFEPNTKLAYPKRGVPEIWTIENGGGGWTHPMHFHMEEHLVLSRDGKKTPTRTQPDDPTREDVVALEPGEEIVMYRNFRTFTGPYVAHCHNLAHEDHAMMFGWEIVP
jgi:FtsP/CotA-like multicopper oxidase with cupredoxin domain